MRYAEYALVFAMPLALSFGLASAQDTLPQLRVEPTGGGSFFYVRNTASQPLTAFLIELVDYPGSSYSFWLDDLTSEPLAPGAERQIRVANMTVGAVPDYVKMQAALYADGTTRGASDKVTELVGRRRFELETLHDLIGRLDKARTAGISKDSLVSDLKKWSDSLQPAPRAKRDSQTAVNQAAARTLISDTITSLGTHSIEDVLAELQASERRAQRVQLRAADQHGNSLDLGAARSTPDPFCASLSKAAADKNPS